MNKIKNNNYLLNNFNHSFIVTGILSSLDLNVTDESSLLSGYSYGIFILSLISLACFINLLCYFFVYFLIQKKDYENKYIRFNRIINYYKNTSLVFAIIESILCLICLIIIIFSSLYILLKIN
jgi:hypothetical protein